MNAIIIEHVDVNDLPATWRARLPAPVAERVTVRIEEEHGQAPGHAQNDAAVDLMFGMWRDHEEVADVESYIRKLRAPRYNRDGSRNDG